MSDPEEKRAPVAWQPFTPSGVAAFSSASLGRVLGFQFLFAALSALTLGWFLNTSWFPVVSSAVLKLPSAGQVIDGRLEWPAPEPVVLGYNSDLGIVIDREHLGNTRVPSDILIELGAKDARLYSLFGYLVFPYKQGYRMALNRSEMQPWWGAWRPPILWVSVLASIAALMLIWGVWAALCSPAVWLAAFFSNRSVGLGECWRMAVTALMPASLVLNLGMTLYRTSTVQLLGFLLIVAGHLTAGLLYALVAPAGLKSTAASTPRKGNPFTKKQNA